MRMHPSTLVLALSIGALTVPAATHANPGVECFNAFKGAMMRLDSVVESSSPDVEARKRDLGYARDKYDAAMRCYASSDVASSPKYAELSAMKPQLDAKMKDAEASIANFAEADALQAEFKALVGNLNKLETSVKVSAEEVAALLSGFEAFKAKVAEAGARNSQVRSSWRERTAREIDSATAKLKKRQEAFDRLAALDRLRQRAVVNRLAGFTAEDAYSLEKVVAAFQQTGAEDVVHTLAAEGTARPRYCPTAEDHVYVADGEPLVAAAQAADLPGYAGAFEKMLGVGYASELKPLPADMPGILWNVEGTDSNERAIFVAADGGRYRARLDNLAPGLTAPATWPKAPLHDLLLDSDVDELGKRNLLPASLVGPFQTPRRAYATCAEKVWNAHDAQFEKIEAANLLPDVREERRWKLIEKVRGQVVAKCKSHLPAYDKAWRAAVGHWRKERSAALEKIQAHLTSLAAK